MTTNNIFIRKANKTSFLVCQEFLVLKAFEARNEAITNRRRNNFSILLAIRYHNVVGSQCYVLLSNKIKQKTCDRLSYIDIEDSPVTTH